MKIVNLQKGFDFQLIPEFEYSKYKVKFVLSLPPLKIEIPKYSKCFLDFQYFNYFILSFCIYIIANSYKKKNSLDMLHAEIFADYVFINSFEETH